MAQIATKTTAELSTDIHVITAEINAYQRVAGEAIFEIGRRLKGVRDNPEEYRLKGYRDWERWCNDELGMSRRYANQFIKVYEEFGADVLPKKGLQALYEIATLPPEEREVEHELSDGTTKKPEDMTVRELREVKRQLRLEQQAREMERAGAERLKAELAKARTEPPRVEVRTEYIRDESVEERLRRYEERFGDIDTLKPIVSLVFSAVVTFYGRKGINVPKRRRTAIIASHLWLTYVGEK